MCRIRRIYWSYQFKPSPSGRAAASWKKIRALFCLLFSPPPPTTTPRPNQSLLTDPPRNFLVCNLDLSGLMPRFSSTPLLPWWKTRTGFMVMWYTSIVWCSTSLARWKFHPIARKGRHGQNIIIVWQNEERFESIIIYSHSSLRTTIWLRFDIQRYFVYNTINLPTRYNTSIYNIHTSLRIVTPQLLLLCWVCT